MKSTSELDDRVAACTILIDTSRSPEQLALALSYRAQSLLNQKKCDAAIADLTRAKDVSPSKKSSDYYDLHLWISYYWQNCKGDFDRGIEVLNEAAAILPRDPAVYNQRANMFSDKGDYAAAMADINRSIALINNDPYRASAYNNRALIWKTMGEYEKSAADFSVAIKLAPKNPKYYANRGDAWRRTGNLERALQDQDRAIELYAGGPGIALGLTLRGETLRYMGEYDRALSDFNQAVRIEPDFAPALHRPRTDVRAHRRSRAREIRVPDGAVDQREFRPGRYLEIRARNRRGASCGTFFRRAAADHPSGPHQGSLDDFGADPGRRRTRGGTRGGQGDRRQAGPPRRTDHRQFRLQIGCGAREPAP